MVTRCICHDVLFAELIALAAREGLDFAALRDRTGCGTGCGMCEPYIHAALRTGRAAQPVMPPPSRPGAPSTTGRPNPPLVPQASGHSRGSSPCP